MHGEVDKLLPTFWRANSDCFALCEVLKIKKHCSQIIFRPRTRSIMNEVFAREFIEVETLERINRSILYKQVVGTLQRQVLLACNKDVMFCRRKSSCSNGHGASCRPVRSEWFEKVETVTVRQLMCLEKPNANWNDKEMTCLQNAAGLVKVYSGKTVRTTKWRAFVM